MSQQVSAPVWIDGNGNFIGGALMGIYTDAIVVGYVQQPAALPLNPYPNQELIQTLQIKDRIRGTLYLNQTIDEWQSLVNTSYESPNTNISFSAMGDTSFTIPANTWFISFAAMGHDGVINVGTTEGGDDIVSGLNISGVDYSIINTNLYFSPTQDTSIYISVLDGNKFTFNYEILLK